jgi:signal transduction histidine kinase
LRNILPRQSTVLFILIALFLLFNLFSYKLLLKNLYDNHEKNQQLTFNLIQRESSNLLTRLLHEYTKQKNTLLEKHNEVLIYLEKESYDDSLDEIYKRINIGNNPFYNIYITDENLIIRNTTFNPDLGFNLSFAKEIFDKHKNRGIIGISPPIFETYSLKFFSFTDSYLAKNDKRILQVGYTYENLNKDLEKLQLLINENKNIKESTAYLIFEDGYIGDFVFKSIKSHKPTLEEVNKRIEQGKALSKDIKDGEYKVEFQDSQKRYKILYFMEKSPIFDEAKIVYSLIFDEKEYQNDLELLNIAMFLISLIGIITIYIVFRMRYNEKLLNYKDKFIEHSIHEIKTPLTVIKLNAQLRNRNSGEDKYSSKIEGAIKSLENSYEDMVFLHTKENIYYSNEDLNIKEVLIERIKYFEVIALTQNRKLELKVSNGLILNMSKIELIRLIDNNLSNAIKYSKIGSIIEILLIENELKFLSYGNQIKDVKKIFKKYSRENNSVGGHGLGLAIVKDICTKYKILIYVNSLENGLNIFSYKFNCHNSDTPIK